MSLAVPWSLHHRPSQPLSINYESRMYLLTFNCSSCSSFATTNLCMASYLSLSFLSAFETSFFSSSPVSLIQLRKNAKTQYPWGNEVIGLEQRILVHVCLSLFQAILTHHDTPAHIVLSATASLLYAKWLLMYWGEIYCRGAGPKATLHYHFFLNILFKIIIQLYLTY